MTHGAHLGAEELSPVHQKLLTSRAGLSGPACQLNKFQQIVFPSPGKVTHSRGNKLGALIASQAHVAQHFPGSLPWRPSGGAQTRGDTFGSPSEFVLLPGLVSRGAVCAGGGPEQFISLLPPLRGRFLHAARGAVLGARPAPLWHFSLQDLPHLWVSDTATSESKSTGIAEPTQTAF